MEKRRQDEIILDQKMSKYSLAALKYQIWRDGHRYQVQYGYNPNLQVEKYE